MSKTRNRKEKKNISTKIKSKGGEIDLNQKYNLESINEHNEIGGFKHSNTVLGFLGVASLFYYVYYKQHTM